MYVLINLFIFSRNSIVKKKVLQQQTFPKQGEDLILIEQEVN